MPAGVFSGAVSKIGADCFFKTILSFSAHALRFLGVADILLVIIGKHEEWLKQADYDMGTADAIPPKTHNLLYLLDKIGKKPGRTLEKFIIKLNTASISTRYPDDLAKIQAAYTEEITADMISNSKEVLAWVKTQFSA